VFGSACTEKPEPYTHKKVDDWSNHLENIKIQKINKNDKFLGGGERPSSLPLSRDNPPHPHRLLPYLKGQFHEIDQTLVDLT